MPPNPFGQIPRMELIVSMLSTRCRNVFDDIVTGYSSWKRPSSLMEVMGDSVSVLVVAFTPSSAVPHPPNL
jgi:hypothetical protein